MRKTREQKARMEIYAHEIDVKRAIEYKAAGIDLRFAKFTRSVDQAKEVLSAGLTFDEWLPWRQERWDLEKYPIMTPDKIAGFVKRGMTITDAKREMSRTYPAPMHTR